MAQKQMGMRNLSSELDYRDGPENERYDVFGTAERLTAYKNLISVGQPQDGISQLGGLDRQLLQDTEYHLHGNTVLKKLSEEEISARDALDFSKLPDNLRKRISSLIEARTNIGTLIQAIKAARGNQETLGWIEDNWEIYIEQTNEEDELVESLERADANALEIITRPPKDQYSS